jgi:hypothetical protein
LTWLRACPNILRIEDEGIEDEAPLRLVVARLPMPAAAGMLPGVAEVG